jgi:O-antigen/teichoic acid export membrane protein
VSEARRTVRNAGWLMAQRGLHVAAATLFALLVPRLMGPEVFGRYALLISVSMWFALLGGLGAVSLMARAVPQFMASGDLTGLRRLVTSLLALRASNGVLTAIAYLLVIALAIGERDLVAAGLVAGAVLARTIANLCFSLFLGLNQAARWGLGDLLRRVLTLAGVLAGFPLYGLRGACFGFLAANLVVLVVGLAGSRQYLDWSLVTLRRSYLTPFLRTGTSFAAGNLLLALAHRSGETVVRVATADYAQVGFFGAAYSIYLTGANAFWQGTIAFGPLLVAQYHAGGRDAVGRWLERLLKWMAIAASVTCLATLLVGRDLVPLVLGASFRPVVDSVWPLSLALYALAVASVGRLGALVTDRPGLSGVAAGAELAAVWALGPPLAMRYGAAGMAVAALAGTVAYAAVTWSARGDVPYSSRAALRAAALALPFAPLWCLRGGWLVNAALFAAASAGYAALLWWRGVVTAEEIRAMRGVLRRGAGEA